SALSYESVADKAIMAHEINYFDNNLWSMWLNNGQRGSPAVLRRTMVFSFAAVWGKALGLLNGPQPPPDDPDPFSLVDEPLTFKQEPLWEALHKKGDKDKFEKYFHLKSSADGVF